MKLFVFILSLILIVIGTNMLKIIGVASIAYLILHHSSDAVEPFSVTNSDDKFQPLSRTNPLGNALFGDSPYRLPAPPANFTNITKQIKRAVQEMYPTMNTGKMMFGDLWDNFELNQSNRAFYTMPSTTIPNDQEKFGQALYGNMLSGHESGFARMLDNTRYIMR